jgi:hypothetical protein
MSRKLALGACGIAAVAVGLLMTAWGRIILAGIFGMVLLPFWAILLASVFFIVCILLGTLILAIANATASRDVTAGTEEAGADIEIDEDYRRAA